MTKCYNPPATAIRNFVERISGSSEPSLVRAIATGFHIEEHGFEFYALMNAQVRNFRKLESQILIAGFGDAAKNTYLRQLRSLARITRHDLFQQKFSTLRADIIEPNIVVLTYLDDAIRTTPELTQSDREEILDLSLELEKIRDELMTSTLTMSVRSELSEQLNHLIFTLRNFDVVGADVAWQQAASTITSVHANAGSATSLETQSILGRVGAVLAAVFAIAAVVNTGLGQIEAGITRATNIAKQLKSGYDLVDSWRPKVPQIEDKSKGQKQPDGLTDV
jgi:hypothetical protein